jgi:hypothetical protein
MPRVGPLEEPNEAVANKARMEGWFTSVQGETQKPRDGEESGRSLRIRTAGEPSVNPSLMPARTFDAQSIERLEIETS